MCPSSIDYPAFTCSQTGRAERLEMDICCFPQWDSALVSLFSITLNTFVTGVLLTYFTVILLLLPKLHRQFHWLVVTFWWWCFHCATYVFLIIKLFLIQPSPIGQTSHSDSTSFFSFVCFHWFLFQMSSFRFSLSVSSYFRVLICPVLSVVYIQCVELYWL